MNLSILEYHINGIIQYLVFYIWQYINTYVGLFYVTWFQVLPIDFYSWIIPLCWYTTVCLFIHQVINFFFWWYWAACGILVPWPGVEPVPPAVLTIGAPGKSTVGRHFWWFTVFWLLGTILLWMFVYRFLCRHMLSVFLGMHIGEELLDLILTVFYLLRNCQTVFQSGHTSL